MNLRRRVERARAPIPPRCGRVINTAISGDAWGHGWADHSAHHRSNASPSLEVWADESGASQEALAEAGHRGAHGEGAGGARHGLCPRWGRTATESAAERGGGRVARPDQRTASKASPQDASFVLVWNEDETGHCAQPSPKTRWCEPEYST